ncbi:MAG: porin family protein [Planctomycetes bacterium]|nr:porin family protein [Planctomycetota bacterium]
MKSLVVLAVLASSSASCASVSGDQARTRGTFLVGARGLDEDLWEPVEKQLVLGGEFSAVSKENGVGYEFGLSVGADSDEVGSIDVTGTTLEASGGLRVEFGTDDVRPYVGVGVALINAEVEADDGSSTVSEDDTSVAAYIHAGVDVPLSERFFIGLDARALLGSDIDLGGVNGDADYFQIGLVFGWIF